MRGIIVAFPDSTAAVKIRDTLISHGLAVRGIAHSGSAVLRLSLLEDGGGVIVCAPTFSDMTTTELFSRLPEDFDFLVLNFGSPLNVEAEEREGLFCLFSPVLAGDLVESVRTLLETRQLPRANSKSGNGGQRDVFAKKSTRTPEEIRIIEAAKLLLMKSCHMSEEEAHRYLQKESMQNGRKMQDTAETVLRQSYPMEEQSS